MRGRLLIAIALILFVSTLLITGCNGARETDEVAYVLLIGIDKKEEGKYDITYQVAVPKSLSGEGGGGADNKSTILITVTATSLAEARNLLSSTVGRSINLSHNKAFVFGEKFARGGLGDFLAPLLRYREFRGSMFVIVAHDITAAEFLEKNQPFLEQLPSKFIETMILTYDDTGYYQRINLHEFYSRMKAGIGATYAMLAGVNDTKEGKDTPVGVKDPGERSEEYVAGKLPIRGPGNPVNFAGTAVFRQDKMIGILTNEETRMLGILEGHFPRGFLVVEDPLVPKKGVNINLRLGKPPDIKVRIVNDSPVISVDILLEGEVTAIPSGVNYERGEYRQQLEQQISRVVRGQMEKMLMKTRDWGADAAGLGYHGRTQFAKALDWARYDWADKYSQSQFEIKVTTKLRRAGLMWQTAPNDQSPE
jgi:Ger(x)C family germination protein